MTSKPATRPAAKIMAAEDFTSLPHRFNHIVGLYPDNTAVTNLHEKHTYAEIQTRTDVLARGLIALGVGKGDRVGVYMDRALDFPLILLAILKAGGVFVPFDPSYPKARLEKMQELSEPTLVVGDPALDPSVTTIAAVEAAGTGISATFPDVKRDDAAYIMFTSGSTGTPKGVVVPHRGILRLVINPNYVDLGPDEIIPQTSALAFDASTFEIWGALLNGATLAVPHAGKLSVDEVGEFLSDSKATTAVFTTGFFHVIIDEKPEVLAGLRQVLPGGDALSAVHVRRLLAAAPSLRVINGYGPTEATTFAVCCSVTSKDPVPEPVPIGYPIDATSVFVFDDNRKPVTDGQDGELYLGGDGLALGYINNPTETAARFVPNPDTSHPHKILYKTGDVVRREKNGQLTFAGRTDQQVKIRGFRIELNEIEDRLREHPLVRDAIVVAKTGGKHATDKTLAAYIRLNHTDSRWRDNLRAHLAATLPPFMLPADWAVLENFPLTPTGKVDRKALTALPIRSAAVEAHIRNLEALSETETLVCRLCAEILGIPEIGADDNFMEIGGDSLSAARLAVRTGAPLKLGEILSAPDLRAIAARVGEKKNAGPSITASPVSRSEFPLSFAQEQLWLVSCAEPDSTAYNEPCLVSMPRAVAPDALSRALAQLVERHPMLRTIYGTRDGVPFQKINDHLSVPLVIHDRDVTREAFRKLAVGDFSRVMDLKQGPIGCARYAVFQDGSAELMLVFHHIAFDGISLFNTLLPELQKLCAGETLPAAEMRYADYAEWQRRTVTHDALAPALRYWEDQLDGLEPLSMPFRTDKKDSADTTYDFVILPSLAAQLRDFAKQEHASLFAVAATTLAAVLHRTTHQGDMAFGFVQATRPVAALDAVVGGFVNTLPLRVRPDGGQNLRSLLKSVSTSIRGAQDHDIPFEAVVAHMSRKLQLRGRSLVDVLISYDPPSPVLTDGWTADHLIFREADPKFPLSVELGDAADGSIRVRFEYDSAFIPSPTIRRMAGHFRAVFETMAASADTPVAQIPLDGAASVNVTPAVPVKHSVIPDMLEQAALAHATREALIFGAQRIDYATLYRITQEKAHALRAQGIGPAKPAALFFRDPLQRCIAAWSVWAAGGAIVPLDPEYPQSRIADCLDQIDACALLTEKDLISSLPGRDAIVFEELSGANTKPSAAAPEDVAYIIFTSGSTGKPKGVAISHANACAMVSAHIAALGPDENLRALQMAGPGFDAYVSELLFTCANAGTLVLAERRSLLPGIELVALVAQEQVNDAFFTPSLLAALTPSDFPLLRTITCAGDFCPPGLAARWIEKGVRFIHAYGPAECTVCATLTVIDRPRNDFLPLGRPLPGYQIYLTDPQGNLALPGTIGEICIGGVGVGIGYLNLPDDKRFTANPFAPGRLYRTGDLGRFNEQDELEFIGRNDLQIKIRGMRVELGEIESALLTCVNVAAAAVIPIKTGAGDTALGAAVTLNNPATDDWRMVLSQQMKNKLPAHMLPSFFTCIEKMPVTANGKIDRRRLPDFKPEDKSVTTIHRSDLSQDERAVLEIWRSVFPQIAEDAEADFFELGGHSLLAAQLVARFNAHFNVSMPMRALFENPTIAAMAAWLRNIAHTLSPTVDPVTDAAMPLTLNFPKQRKAGGDILLTGASGFVGRYLLRELLANTSARIHCIVRGGAQRLGMQSNRIVAIDADLSSPDFLAASHGTPFKAIYHCGALVNSIYPYSAVRAANVIATHKLIEFAAAQGADFNHISTVGVFENAQRSRTGLVLEEEMSTTPPPEDSGYNCSKWVAEMLVHRAVDQGLTGRIFRLGRVGWSNGDGGWNDNDFLHRLLQGCLQLNAAPSWDMDFRIVPVDFLARSIVGISSNPASAGHTSHLVGKTILSWPQLTSMLLQRQPQLRVLSHQSWWDELSLAKDNALTALAEKLSPAAAGAAAPDFATAKTTELLQNMHLNEPAIDLAKCPL